MESADPSNNKKLPLVTLSLTAIILLAIGLFFTLGGIVYTGSNIPPGLYFRVDKPLGIGKLVTFCPPDQPVFQVARKSGLIGNGSCPNGYECLMFTIAGKRKDVVTINADGVYVNDTLLAESKPLTQDKEGRTMPALTLDHYELKENEVLLMTGFGKDAFDSRYFGVVDVQQVDSVISPAF